MQHNLTCNILRINISIVDYIETWLTLKILTWISK